MASRISRGALAATLVGNTLEFYDFLIYSFFAVYVGVVLARLVLRGHL